MAKRSFFEKLTGAVHADPEDYDLDEVPREETSVDQKWERREGEAELNVDVINTPDEVVIKALVAGVRPEDLDISITREIVTIHGERRDVDGFADEDYIHGELFWGSFTRTILLPEEIEVEEAEAKASNGMIIITLPKIDKKRETKLEIKTDH